MKIVEFTGPDEIGQIRELAKAISKYADYDVRVAIDEDGFKVSIDRGVWSPGYGTRKD